MPTLYVTDLDGTLLRDDATLSPYSRETLNGLLRRGVAFAVASARSIVSIRPILAGLELRLPVIEFNGAFLSELETGRHLLTYAMPSEIVPGMLELIHEADCRPFIMTTDGERDHLYHGEIAHEGMQQYMDERLAAKDDRLAPLEDLPSVLAQQVMCINIVDRRERLVDLQKALQDRFPAHLESHLFVNTYLPGWHWLMVHEKSASKDVAIRTLMEREGLGDHELVVFGDNDNDVPMFRIADRAVAVGNATDLLKEHATEVIGTNEEDSVARYILDDSEKRR